MWTHTKSLFKCDITKIKAGTFETILYVSVNKEKQF